jgi:CubicO group peptidase (beta-lactamase class C family)
MDALEKVDIRIGSASDLVRWSRGMLTAKLFGPALVRESLTPYKGNYGYGWQVRRFFDRPIYNHTGGIDGFSSHLAHYPDQKLTIVVLSNIENESAILRACDLAGLLFEWRPATDMTDSGLTPRQRCGLDP